VALTLLRSELRPVNAGQSASHSNEQLGRVMRADLALIQRGLTATSRRSMQACASPQKCIHRVW